MLIRRRPSLFIPFTFERFIVFLILLSLNFGYVSAYEQYILCPLSSQIVPLAPDDSSELKGWFVASNFTNETIPARACWCIHPQNPAFCPAEFDSCRISSNHDISCVYSEITQATAVDWIVPFLGPIMVLLYCALIFACVCTRRGMAARGYVMRQICTCCGMHNKTRYLQSTLDHTNRIWIRVLLRQGVARERRELRRLGRADPYLAPTHLELKTKLYQKPQHLEHGEVNEADLELGVQAKVKEDEIGGQTCEENPETNLYCKVEHPGPSIDHPVQEIGHEELHHTSDEHSIWSDHGDTCAICMATLENGDRVGDIPCNHLFHVEPCLKRWLRKKNECPLCCAPNVGQQRA